jgi:hypothetical protein
MKNLHIYLEGNYSTLIAEFKFRRQIGHYVLDYYLPSMFLVSKPF